MHAGMLWVDNASGIPLEKSLEKAADFYRRKYGRVPNLCLVHPSILDAPNVRFGKLTVRAYAPLLRGHMWIGVQERRPTSATRIR